VFRLVAYVKNVMGNVLYVISTSIRLPYYESATNAITAHSRVDALSAQALVYPMPIIANHASSKKRIEMAVQKS
jgi:hypothetical protein